MNGKNRGVNGEPEYAILTSEISKAAFGLTPSEYKNLKGLERENLRDHMTDLELIFSMLGEAATTEIARKQEAQGFGENKIAARKGGQNCRRGAEKAGERNGREGGNAGKLSDRAGKPKAFDGEKVPKLSKMIIRE